jgi:ABC-type branched-subunit amino acid transport system substrate-binding protein
MTRSRRTLGAIIITLLTHSMFILACGGTRGPGERIPVEERRAYAAAVDVGIKDSPLAEARLKAFLAEYPESRLADDASEELARLALLDGRREEARGRLHDLVERYPDGDRADSIRVRLARWENDSGDGWAARSLLAEVDESRLDSPALRAYHGLRALLSEDSAEKFLHLARLREALEREKLGAALALNEELDRRLARVDSELDALLPLLSGQELLRATRELGTAVPAGRVRLTLAWRALVAGDLDAAVEWLALARKDPLTASDRMRLESVDLRLGERGEFGEDRFLPTYREAASRPWPAVGDVEARIGVVLPLSGRYESFGAAALKGLLLAAQIFDEAPPERRPGPVAGFQGAGGALSGSSETGADPLLRLMNAISREFFASESRSRSGVELRVRDSGGNPERAAAAIREFAADENIAAVVGPIFSAESEAAALEAERLGIPLLTLSNREQIARGREFVFRLRMTPDDEIDRLVDYAVADRGAEKFAVLYPLNRYGRGMRSRYWNAVLDRGGIVVAAAGYEPDATDFSASIRSLAGFDLLTADEEVALRERSQALRRGRRLDPEVGALLKEILYRQLGPEADPLPPRVDFDALFIPDTHEKIQLITPQLAFHEIEGVQLLGSGDWNHPDLVQIARGHVRGAIISSGFHSDSRFGIVSDFVVRYRESFASRPDEFSANAFDALNLVLTQLAEEKTSRIELKEGMLRVHAYPGVSGVTSFLSDGNARKRPFLIEVQRRRFVGLD